MPGNCGWSGRTGSEVPACGIGQRGLQDTHGPPKQMFGAHRSVLPSRRREITSVLLTARQADVDQLTKLAP